MELYEKRLEVGALEKGMFISRLDREWEGTPFELQGVYLESDEQLAMLGGLCTHVFIDLRKSIDPDGQERGALVPESAQLTRPAAGTARARGVNEVEREAPMARRARDHAIVLAGQIIEEIRRGDKLSPDLVASAVDPVVESVVRSADAFFWVEALSEHGSYHYVHAITCAALAASFGRHMGLPKPMLVELATGAMLMDIGKATLPPGVIDHAGPLSAGQVQTMRGHVGQALALIEQAGLASPEMSAMVAGHHERHDGSGYPEGLSGTTIPLYARMLGIIDTYDAMTSERPHQRARSKHEALEELYRQRDGLFQAQLVEQFTQCLGVYPTGSLVELNTGQVALVMAQNRARRLLPRVTILTDADKKIDPSFPQVDLLLESATPVVADRIHIVRALPPGAYGLDTAGLYL